jgi:HEAT repeat protein
MTHALHRSRRLAPAGVLALLAAGCSPGASAREPQGEERSRVEREVHDLMTALTPPRADALPVEKSSWYAQRRKTLERMRSAGRAVGLEALRLYREDPPALPEVRAGLLDVAAHTAPEETAPILVQLVQVFGEHDIVRAQAVEFLGETSPDLALEVLTPLLGQRPDGRTYPPEERLLLGWVSACRATGTDPVPLLASIATDLARPQEVRHLATRSLGEFDSPQSRQALQNLLVESGGNGYVRRLACQSLRQLLPAEEFCPLVEGVMEREADPDFLRFLDDVHSKSCS